MKKLTIVFATAGLLFVALVVSAHGPEQGYQIGPWMMWGHGMGWIFPVILIVLMLVICFRMMGRRGDGSSWCGHGADTPLDILIPITGKFFIKVDR